MIDYDVLRKTSRILHSEIDFETSTRTQLNYPKVINRKSHDPDCSILGWIQDVRHGFEIILDLVHLDVWARLNRTLGYLDMIQTRLGERLPEKRRD